MLSTLAYVSNKPEEEIALDFAYLDCETPEAFFIGAGEASASSAKVGDELLLIGAATARLGVNPEVASRIVGE